MINLISLLNKDKPPVLPRYKKGQKVSGFLRNNRAFINGEIINFDGQYYNVLVGNVIQKVSQDRIKLNFKEDFVEYSALLKEYNLYCAKQKLIKAQEEYDKILNS